MAKEVIVYSQPNCGACTIVKDYLSQKGVEFEERDIRANPQYVKELIGMGHRATPITMVDGETVVGADREKLDELLGE